MTINKEQAVSDADVERAAFAIARVIANRHGGNHQPDDWLNDERRAEARAALEAASHPLEQQQAVSGDVVERLHERLADTQMLAFKWMEAHDKLHAGKPYEFPKPADLPDALAEKDAEIKRLRAALTASGVERMRASDVDEIERQIVRQAELFSDVGMSVNDTAKSFARQVAIGAFEARTALQEEDKS